MKTRDFGASIPVVGASPAASPQTWLLVDDRPGHRTQVVGLARLLGLDAIEKRLAFRLVNWLPNTILGATRMTLDRTASDPVGPPFPDLVIGMGRRVAPVARWIRRASGGRTCVVLLGRKGANDMRNVDLGIVCAHFGFLPHPRLVEMAVPPTQVDVGLLAEAAAARPDPLAGLGRPRVVLLVGGPTAQHRLDADVATTIAGTVAAAVDALGGILAIVTSRRTPDAAVAAIRRAAPAAHLHVWRRDQTDNPYLSYLAAADLLAVTGESESMLAEASATGRPLTICPLPLRPETLKYRFARWLRRRAEISGPLGETSRALLVGGWVAPPRDISVMHALMVERGLARLFDGTINTAKPCRNRDIERVGERVASLLVSRDRTAVAAG